MAARNHQGAVDAVITTDGRAERPCGAGYHDHNWGNVPPRKVLAHRHDAFTLEFGAAGAYLRFTGDVTIEHRLGADVTTRSAQTLWELLYFGARRGAAESTAGPEALIGHQA